MRKFLIIAISSLQIFTISLKINSAFSFLRRQLSGLHRKLRVLSTKAEKSNMADKMQAAPPFRSLLYHHLSKYKSVLESMWLT